MLVAEVYIHLKSEVDEREQQERFGQALSEYATDAARRFIGDCYVEIIVDEGSTKAKARVWQSLTLILTVYSVTADYDSFCKQAGVIYQNTETFLNTVAQRVKYGEVPATTFDRRIERRHKTTGKLKQVADLLLELNDNQHLMTANQYHEKIDGLIEKLGEIQKEVSEEEMRHLLKVLSIETLHARAPEREPIDLFRSPNVLHRPRTESEEFDQEISEIIQDEDHVGETRVVPIPRRIFHHATLVQKPAVPPTVKFPELDIDWGNILPHKPLLEPPEQH
jgi:hypothetical protein